MGNSFPRERLLSTTALSPLRRSFVLPGPSEGHSFPERSSPLPGRANATLRGSLVLPSPTGRVTCPQGRAHPLPTGPTLPTEPPVPDGNSAVARPPTRGSAPPPSGPSHASSCAAGRLGGAPGRVPGGGTGGRAQSAELGGAAAVGHGGLLRGAGRFPVRVRHAAHRAHPQP